jgi:hypothetical protein
VFITFCTKVQAEKELKIIKARSDHGGEFENEHLNLFVKIMEFSVSSLLLELHRKKGL